MGEVNAGEGNDEKGADGCHDRKTALLARL